MNLTNPGENTDRIHPFFFLAVQVYIQNFRTTANVYQFENITQRPHFTIFHGFAGLFVGLWVAQA